MNESLIIFCLVMLCPFFMDGQDEITIEDYRRAVSFRYDNYHNKKVFNLYVRPHWFSDSSGVWFINQALNSKKYRKIALPDMIESDLFDHERLAVLLADSLGFKIKASDIPIESIEYLDASHLKITVKQKTYVLDIELCQISLPSKDEAPSDLEERSPDGKWIAYAKDHNLYLKSTESGAFRQLSTKGTKNYEYATWYGWADIMEGENADRPERFGVNWSPDSRWISTNICDLRSAQKMYLLDWSIDTLYRPKLLSYYRGSPGDTTMVFMEPVFFNAETGAEIKPNLPRGTHINSTGVRWSNRSNLVYLQFTKRGYQDLSVYSFNLTTQHLDRIYSETSETNIDNFRYLLVEERHRMFVLSEKSGWRQLYAIDLINKKETAITNGAYYVNSIERIDEANQKIYFLASGKEPGRNPYYQNLYSIDFDGSNLKLLTPADFHHRISISPDGTYFVDNYSTVNIPTTTVLRNLETGEVLRQMTKADASLLTDWSPPEIFSTTGGDGRTPIYGAYWKPTNFDSTQSYPVIESSYTGPHTQVFPKDYSRAFGLQAYAELGFIVVVIDGRGSSGRSKEFHNYSYKNLGGNLEDHIAAIRYLGRKHRWIDTTRVGIFGHSAGGYDAGHAVLAYPDFYKVAVASSADHDHRMEKAWWPEMYMGWPVDSAYHQQSNITMAGNLEGKLLITHGGIDENVNPSATFKLAEALIKADKQFDMLILPSQRHGYRGDHQKYFTKTRWNYFVKHLRGVEPIWDFPWE